MIHTFALSFGQYASTLESDWPSLAFILGMGMITPAQVCLRSPSSRSGEAVSLTVYFRLRPSISIALTGFRDDRRSFLSRSVSCCLSPSLLHRKSRSPADRVSFARFGVLGLAVATKVFSPSIIFFAKPVRGDTYICILLLMGVDVRSCSV